MVDLSRRLAVARGDEPAELVIRGGRVFSAFTREWLETDVAVVDGWIAGLGEYEGVKQIDAAGRYVVPGFVDAHLHLESSKLLVDEFARLVLPLGTTAVVADPHEIANVLGTDGVHWLLYSCDGLPLEVYFMASSCVPASSLESHRREQATGYLECVLRRRTLRYGLGRERDIDDYPGDLARAIAPRRARPRLPGGRAAPARPRVVRARARAQGGPAGGRDPGGGRAGLGQEHGPRQ